MSVFPPDSKVAISSGAIAFDQRVGDRIEVKTLEFPEPAEGVVLPIDWNADKRPPASWTKVRVGHKEVFFNDRITSRKGWLTRL